MNVEPSLSTMVDLDKIAEYPECFEFTSYRDDKYTSDGRPNCCEECGSFGPFIHDEVRHVETCLRCGHDNRY